MKYPTMNEVAKASHEQICEWYRFLPSPESDEQLKIINCIVERCKEYGGFTPVISKKIGWDRR